MSKRVPGTQKTVLTVSDEIIQRSLGSDSNKLITDIRTNPLDISDLYKGKLVWKEVGSFLENLKPIEEPITDPTPNLVKRKKNLLNAPLNYRICNNCNRPLLETHIAEHLEVCEEIMKVKQAVKEKSLASNSNNTNNITKQTKKRKNLYIDDSSTKESTPLSTPIPTTKKQKKQPKEKRLKKEKIKAAPKTKEPVDVEKQCGVPLPGGGFCARSLTCKTHSMGAKRAVPGRSAPYDQLLAAYQRKNQAKIAAGAALAQAAQDELVHGSLVPLDEDEETQLVIEGVSRSYPLPLERKVIVPTRIRSGFLRMREMFASALLPRVGNATAGGIEGRTLIVDVDKPNEYFHVVRPPQRVAINQLQQHYHQQQQQQQQQIDQQKDVQKAKQLQQELPQQQAQQVQQQQLLLMQQKELQQQRLLQLLKEQRMQQALQLHR